MNACIIGAGSTGLVALKTLREAGLAPDCFELLGSGIGGNWRYGNDNGRSAAYDSLHIDTSKDRMAFSDFPMPEQLPNYPHHSQVLEYFERYAERFDLARHVAFRHRVESVAPVADGGWEVEVRDLDADRPLRRRYDAVAVANGHHWSPRLPDLPGRFDGPALHSRDYRSPQAFAGRRVLVVGIGNSGADIACDCGPVAARTLLAARRPVHVIPRHLLGRPTDKWATPLASRLPLAVQRALYGFLLWLERGRQADWGAPRPASPLLAEHPTLSSQLLPLVRDGRVEIVPGVAELAGDRVRFEDGREEPVDAIVYATGYRIELPFLAADVGAPGDNEVELYLRVVPPGQDGLYFLGLIQPLGAIMPLAELQARWVAGLLTGELALPSEEEMRRWIAADREELRTRYSRSPRHTIQVDFFPYRRLLEREIAGGRRRSARRHGRRKALRRAGVRR